MTPVDKDISLGTGSEAKPVAWMRPMCRDAADEYYTAFAEEEPTPMHSGWVPLYTASPRCEDLLEMMRKRMEARFVEYKQRVAELEAENERLRVEPSLYIYELIDETKSVIQEVYALKPLADPFGIQGREQDLSPQYRMRAKRVAFSVTKCADLLELVKEAANADTDECLLGDEWHSRAQIYLMSSEVE